MCRREIMHYQRIDSDKQLCRIDIHARPETLQARGLSLAEAMQRMRENPIEVYFSTGL